MGRRRGDDWRVFHYGRAVGRADDLVSVMGSPFRSFGNVPIVGHEKPPTKAEMAADLAEETILRWKELRAEAKAVEEAAELPLAWSPEAQECIDTLEALLKGPHRWVVVPVLVELMPEFAVPPTDEEKAAVERYLAEQGKANG